MDTKLKSPPKPSGLLREFAEIMSKLPPIWDTMDKHFEKVAKPSATRACPNCHGQGSKTTVVRMRVECDACGGGGIVRED